MLFTPAINILSPLSTSNVTSALCIQIYTCFGLAESIYIYCLYDRFFFTFSKHHELEFFVTIIIFVVEYVYISHTFTKCFIHDPILSNDTATALILMKR